MKNLHEHFSVHARRQAESREMQLRIIQTQHLIVNPETELLRHGANLN